jgi:exopolysaccharide biosynthesis polyprenyl glycosylphosphotransferase
VAEGLDGRVSTDPRSTTAHRHPPLTRPTGLRRARRRAIAQPITEGRSHGQIRLREAVFRRSLALADVLAASLALVVCVNVLGDDRLRLVALLALPLVVVTGKAHRLYDRDELVVNKTTMDQAPALFQCATLYALLVLLLEPTFVDGSLSTVQVVGLWMTLFISALLARRTARWIANMTTSAERILFVGVDDSYERLRSKLPKGNRHAQLVGRMTIDALPSERVLHAGAATLQRMVADLDVHRVVIEPSEALPETTLDFVREAKATGLRVSLLPRILEVVGSTIEVDDVDGLTLLGLRRFGLSRSSRRIKRSFDACGSAIGVLLLGPVLLAIAGLIKLDSRGPVIYRQVRIGRDGQAFEMWKFRSMVKDADAAKATLRSHVDPCMGLFKIRDDPRITRAGRWLRECSLDELPQLVNVMRGEMSLVGPRPLIADEDRQISGLDRARLQLTPGMTGHWQIQGARVPLEEMVKLDYLYVAGWSLWSDIKILLRTVVYVLARRGM